MYLPRNRSRVCALFFVAAVLAAAQFAAAGLILKILPLGDSITNGYNKGEFQGPGTGAYRTQLWKD